MAVITSEGTTVRETEQPRPKKTEHDDKLTSATLTGGSSLELIGGGAAVVLAIIGLAGTLPVYMTAIATIAIGGGLLAHGAAAAARWTDAMNRFQGRDRAALEGGLGSEVAGGAAGIVLGILALVGIVPITLLSIAAIVLGGSILLGAPAQPVLANVASEQDRFERATYSTVQGVSGAMALAGAGAIVLGILALLNIGPQLTLILVSMIAIGGVLFLEGSALTARFARRLQHA